MKEAGFRETRVEHLVGPDSMVIGIKQPCRSAISRLLEMAPEGDDWSTFMEGKATKTP